MAAAVLSESKGESSGQFSSSLPGEGGPSLESHLRLIDDPHDVQSSDRPSIFGCLTLGIIEVSGHCDHGMGNLQDKRS